MRGRLHQIQNWDALAAEAAYNVRGLARCAGVSVRQLERFFSTVSGLTPDAFLRQSRMKRALELLSETPQIKEVAAILHYKQAAHFSREFRRFYGKSPTEALELQRRAQEPAASMSPLDNKRRV
jgi:transcriptional regulator GlxA family with amidase domain